MKTPFTKREVLTNLTFGARVAEEEREELINYFVETDQWAKVLEGKVDVVFGIKGSGKSAIYTSLMGRAEELEKSNILLLSAEKPRGNTVFQGLVSSPPTSEIEFISIWKLYFLSLVGSLIADKGMSGEAAKVVETALLREGLLAPGDASLGARFRMVWDWIRKAASKISPQAELNFNPATSEVNTKVKISLEEPSAQERQTGTMSLDDLLYQADKALADNQMHVWILIDRLDVAFSESRELEANGIRALFKTYLDMGDLDHISLKVFLRTDIWDEITDQGFREASHITRQLRIEWSNESLLNLVVSRAVRSPQLVDYYSTTSELVLSSSEKQRQFFDSMVPEKVDAGRNPQTFEWVLGRVQDGTRQSAPREVIHLLNEARDAQVRMLERGENEPSGTELLGRSAFREALSPVSDVRLKQTIYAEYPDEKVWIEKLEDQLTEQTVESLAVIWGLNKDAALAQAQRLVDIGVLEFRNHKGNPTFWVPFLYRPALKMRQGAAV